MAKAERYQINAMPIAALLGAVASFKLKKTPEFKFSVAEGAEFVTISYTTPKGAEVVINYTGDTMAEVPGGEPVVVPGFHTVTVGGVVFNTNDKHCPGKIKTAVRLALRMLVRAINKANGVSNRVQGTGEKAQARAAAKAALELL